MSQEPAQLPPTGQEFDEWVRTIREFWAAFNRRDFESAVKYVHPDCELQDHPDFPDSRWHQGYAGATEWLGNLLAVIPDLQIHPQEVIPADNSRVVVPVVFSGSGKRGGVPLEGALVAVVTMRNGKGQRVALYRSKEDALEAVGLRE